MSEVIDPRKDPVLAAQQVLLEAIKAGALPSIGQRLHGESASQGTIAFLEALTTYYRKLPAAQ